MTLVRLMGKGAFFRTRLIVTPLRNLHQDSFPDSAIYFLAGSIFALSGEGPESVRQQLNSLTASGAIKKTQ